MDDGPAKGTSFIEKYESNPTGTDISISVDLKLNGFFKGGFLGTKRILRCHPIKILGGNSGFDPAPKLKKENKGYQIPHGFLYRYISCPNYFGEILEWIGWALATWSLAGLSFAIWAIANLAPRSYSNYLWYKEKFPDYPKDRKILIPKIW